VVSNPKAQAWDAIGLNYYFRGSRKGKPTRSTIHWFTSDLVPASRCLVIGGTSIGVIRASIATGCQIEVIDFSLRVCEELRDRVPDSVRIVRRDILQPLAAGPFTHVLCDALINRFDETEACSFRDQLSGLICPSGVFRTTVKLGHYAYDTRLMEIASSDGADVGLWDETTRTFDYSRLGNLLERGRLRNGGIRREELLAWYRNRGREKRYEVSDLKELFGPPTWSPPEISAENGHADRVLLATCRIGT
jgi:hypothetical protein